jgi:hypothetical protein
VALAAAMARHPAAGVRGPAPALVGTPSFATVAALLTGPWRVNDPVAFASAMRSAPLVAGYPVVDLCASARRPTVDLDPLSAALAGHLETAAGAAAARSGLSVRWVAAVGGRCLFVEAAARVSVDEEGPELLVLAHLVEPAVAEPFAGPAPIEDDSWLVVVVGDGRGGVAGIGRAALPRAAGSGSRPRPAWATAAGGAESVAAADADPQVRLNLALLRERLIGPALDAEGLAGPGDADAQEAVVLPFRR